ncbi:hypothetical protein [uncultured Muribaculum sp.]|nr:hypothetical protein [uncultured Muribaculum sp.]
MSFDLVCALAYKTKAQTFAIRCLSPPQATIYYGISPRRMARIPM